MCLECLHEQEEGSTWEQQANDVWSGEKKKRRVHTKRVGIKLYDCEQGILRSQCKQGCGGGSICEHFIQRSQSKQGCGGGSICEHGKRLQSSPAMKRRRPSFPEGGRDRASVGAPLGVPTAPYAQSQK